MGPVLVGLANFACIITCVLGISTNTWLVQRQPCRWMKFLATGQWVSPLNLGPRACPYCGTQVQGREWRGLQPCVGMRLPTANSAHSNDVELQYHSSHGCHRCHYHTNIILCCCGAVAGTLECGDNTTQATVRARTAHRIPSLQTRRVKRAPISHAMRHVRTCQLSGNAKTHVRSMSGVLFFYLLSQLTGGAAPARVLAQVLCIVFGWRSWLAT